MTLAPVELAGFFSMLISSFFVVESLPLFDVVVLSPPAAAVVDVVDAAFPSSVFVVVDTPFPSVAAVVVDADGFVVERGRRGRRGRRPYHGGGGGK